MSEACRHPWITNWSIHQMSGALRRWRCQDHQVQAMARERWPISFFFKQLRDSIQISDDKTTERQQAGGQRMRRWICQFDLSVKMAMCIYIPARHGSLGLCVRACMSVALSAVLRSLLRTGTLTLVLLVLLLRWVTGTSGYMHSLDLSPDCTAYAAQLGEIKEWLPGIQIH